MLGRLHLAPLLNQWLQQNPTMRAELTLNDHVVNMIEGGFDLALRIGHLADTSLVARPVGVTPYVVCASPTLIAERGTTAHPQELDRSEEHTSELQSRGHLVCRLLLEKK